MRLTDWFSSPTQQTRAAYPRCVVVDLETSGLDTQSDRILSIGAVAVVNRQIAVADAFEALVSQSQMSSRENVEIHGITHSQQRSGKPEADVIAAFEAWRAGAPIVGWKVGFDAAFLKRAFAAYRVKAGELETLAVDQLAVVLLGSHANSLDTLAEDCGVQVVGAHDASIDAWMTAQIFLMLSARAHAEGVRSFTALRSLAKQAKWV
jgi:DNA polymerase III subunit epsilon